EAGKASDTGAGSQGYLYQALIEASLREIAPNPHDLDSRFSYLTELAWTMSQSSGGGGLGAESLRQWHGEYCDMHLVEYEWTRTLSEFVDAGVLREVDDCVYFAYPYIQYFFIARYLRSHIHDEQVRAKVAELAKELHVEKSATVMIFLAHLTSDPFVLESVLKVAETMFESSDEWDTTSHAGYFNSLLIDDPELTLLERTLEDNRFDELQRKDEQELEREHVGHDPLRESGGVEDQIEEVLNVNSALKMIQVLGQILRSYPGSLKGDMKVRLANACYQLGFRVAGFALHGIESNGEEILNQLTDNLAQIRPEMNAGKRSENASAFLFALCDRFVFGVVRHISQSLGHEALAPVFRKVAAASGGAASYRLVDLAIKLEHANQVPADEAISLYESDRKNKLVVTAVRRLVWYHLYLFPVNYRTRQRLCDKLAISEPDRLSGQRQKLVPKGYKG
ncbi:MAG: hypothetical protein GY924_05860, partial [Planctomycetaceae bacterium]|nr:hypothetical protein [Planctomycetaceae bacterium]